MFTVYDTQGLFVMKVRIREDRIWLFVYVIIILKVIDKRYEESDFKIEDEMNELIEMEKNKQLAQFSLNYFNQIKNNIKIKYFDE